MSRLRIARNRVFLDAAHPSHIVLPLIDPPLGGPD